ncbi:MAG: UBP-type zinc finger domain-containing protein [Bacteroidia bacterium]|nr:UBP-type zinc finger domain-containing protein [Bacteroidia bacterium]
MSLFCEHWPARKVQPPALEAPVCEVCVQTGGTWVHLRQCLTCGKVHCCNSSPGRHATAHYEETGHPVAVSAEKGERWGWCYEDRKMMEY